MNTIEYLKSPELVFKVQNYFGVRDLTESTAKGELNRNNEKRDIVITNKLWHYVLLFGTELGDELFYALFIPFWFWNCDGYVGRRVVSVWAIVMYIGQGIKDIVRWPRPGYPVIRLQNKWALEYGMPSTHAMVGVSIPFSVLFYTLDRYQYDGTLAFFIAVAWCSLICVSRLYLGMHTVLDIIAGLALAILLMFPLVPAVSYADNYLLTNPTAPILLLVSSILMIVYYPNSEKWTPTRGDTTMILSVTVGIRIGAWLNYQTGIMSSAELSPPYTIYWPSYYMLGCALLRTMLGISIVLATRIICERVFYNLLCTLLGKDVDSVKNSAHSPQNTHKTIIELGCKYITCATIGFFILYILPHLFRVMRIERPTFYTEI